MNHLILMRHGQSQWNLENRFTGFKDVPLSDLGITEAKNAGALLKKSGIAIDHVFTSTLQRAYTTAQLALDAAGLSLPLTQADALRERDYGDLTGLNKDETAAKYGAEQVQIWRRSYDVQPPGGESLADVVTRVAPYYAAHIQPKLAAGETVLIAAHGNSLRALLIVLGLYTPETINTAEIPTGAPMAIRMNNDIVIDSHYLA